MRFVIPRKMIESTLPDLATCCSRKEAYGARRSTPFMWRARRPSGTMRGMVVASLANDGDWEEFWAIQEGRRKYVVLDPMAGNGTTARESARMGLVGIAGDINPIACANMVASFQHISPETVKRIEMIPDTIYKLYSTRCEICHRESPILMRVWGSRLKCSKGHVFLAAPKIWKEHPLRAVSQFREWSVSQTEKCECGERARFSPDRYVLLWITYRCPEHGRADKLPDEEDLAKIEQARKEVPPDFFNEEIPAAWSEYLSRGFSRARDLFFPEMLIFLHHAITIAKEFDCKTRLLLLLADAMRSSCRIAKIAYRTFLPFSGKAIFLPHTAELSPVSGIGRTWFSFLRHPEGDRFPVVNTNSARAVPLASNSVDAVVTDPPYYDYISYSSSAYFAYLVLSLPCVPLESEIGKRNFVESMTMLFRECFRVLKPDGVVAFTFRHPNYMAWKELGEAIMNAGGVVSAIHAVQNDVDTRLGRTTVARDAVVVCARREERKILSVSLDEIVSNFDARDVCGGVPGSVMAWFVNREEIVDRAVFERTIKAVQQRRKPEYRQLSL